MLKLICTSIILLIMHGYSIAGAAPGSLNLALPGTIGSYQSDSFRAEGLDCSMGIGSATNVEFGVIGIIPVDSNNVASITSDPTTQTRNVGVYGRIVIPIGAPKNRLDCNELYQLELKKKRMEVQRLEQEIQNLRSLKFENAVTKQPTK